MQMVDCLNYFEEKLLDCILFLAFEDLLNCDVQPFHDHYWGIINWKNIQNLRNVFASQDGQDVVLPNKASGETNPT